MGSSLCGCTNNSLNISSTETNTVFIKLSNYLLLYS